jgi:PAS domain S-box-containing protein
MRSILGYVPENPEGRERRGVEGEGTEAREPRHSPEPVASAPEELRGVLAAIVESSDDAIVGKDLNGIIMTWNAGAERVFGYKAEEVTGLSVTILVPPERLDEEAHILATLRRGERIDHFETERVRKDGRRVHISLSASPIRNARGEVVGVAKIARDITARKRLEVERQGLLAKEQAARTLAEATSRAKDAFLAMISHELRSPLSPILAWARLLRQGMLDDEKTQRALEAIERSAVSQAHLIDDLLDISRIVAGKLRLQVRPVQLTEVIEAAIEIVRPAAEARQIRLQTVLDTETGVIAGDPERLQQVLWNLLANAIKFTPKGGRVQITLERVNSHVEIAVSDTGQGIPAEFLPYLFERFQQAETGSARRYGGLGLGLAIVRHIVELHGGTVYAESPGEGQGATFTVKLPRMIFARTAGELERRHPTVGALSEGKDYPPLRGLRVLVVDDEPDSNEVVSAVLASCGAEVRVAGSAAEGLDELRHWKPDVLVSDIGMPGEDGYAFLGKVRALGGETGRIPAIALTAYATTEDRVRIFSAGFQVHIAKPIEPAELVTVVASAAHRLPSLGPG